MALDAATLALTAAELKTTLADAKIAKLFEPTRDELVITLRTRTETYSLLLSARSGSARVCLTEESFENPETPPSFCMLMRKHLTGGKLLDVLKHIPPVNKILIILGRVGDIEIVSAGAVVAGIHPVERKGYLRQHIGADGRLRPCGVYLTGCHIGYVCLEGHGHVGRALIGTSEMHGDAFGNIGQACRHGSSPPFRIGAGHRSGCAPSVISRYG